MSLHGDIVYSLYHLITLFSNKGTLSISFEVIIIAENLKINKQTVFYIPSPILSFEKSEKEVFPVVIVFHYQYFATISP